MIQSGYRYLYADTLGYLRTMLSKLDQERHLNCYLLGLKILSRILKYPISIDHRHTAINLYIDCLVAVSQNLVSLPHSERECYYSEVKNLIGII